MFNNINKTLRKQFNIGKPKIGGIYNASNMLAGYSQPIQPRIGGVKKGMTNKQFRKADSDGDGVPNWKDCRPLDPTRDMVHYGYYEATLEGGKKVPIYSGSKKGARKILADQGIEPMSIIEMSFTEAKEKYGEEGLTGSRKQVKNMYNWRGDKIVEVPE